MPVASWMRCCGAVGEVCADAPSGQDPPDRVRPLCSEPAALSAGWKKLVFSFLGFTFICAAPPAGASSSLNGRPDAIACGRSCRAIKQEMRRRMHQPIPVQGKWLPQVVSGYFNYHAVPTNSRALHAFRHFIAELWQRSLRRRSPKHSMSWERFTQLANDWLPKPRIFTPGRKGPVRRQTPKVGAVCLNWARTALCGGRSVMSVPTAIWARQFTRPPVLIARHSHGVGQCN